MNPCRSSATPCTEDAPPPGGDCPGGVEIRLGSEAVLSGRDPTGGGRRDDVPSAVTGTLRVTAPAGWTIAPAAQAFQLATIGGETRLRFMVTAPAQSATASLAANAEIGGVIFGNQRVEIHYAHLAPLLLQPAARCKAVSLELSIRGRNVGYVRAPATA